MDVDDQVQLLKIRFLGVDHWIIDGIAFTNDDADPALLNTTVLLNPGSDDNITQGVLVEAGAKTTDEILGGSGSWGSGLETC